MTAQARRWICGWAGGAALGTANGILRETAYARRLGEEGAHRLSTATLLSALAVYTRALQARWPLRDPEEARVVGSCWVALTVLFEFALGRLVAKLSWREMLADYDLRRGRVWILIPAFMAVAPALWMSLDRDGRPQPPA